MAQTARTTFVDLMALVATGGIDQYMNQRPSFNPGGNVAYGGHVYSQSAWAASQTVDGGMVLHNIHGYFTLGGFTDRPYLYSVTHISEGRSFCTRSVTVRQPTTPSALLSTGLFEPDDARKELGKICFACICSFKRDEVTATKHQANVDLEEVYAPVIKGRDPAAHSLSPFVDAPWYWRFTDQYHRAHNHFPGLEMRKVDMSAFNQSKPPYEYRQLTYYRALGTIAPTEYNLHACAHLYACDRNSLFIVSNAVGFGDYVGAMGSLSISVVFHVNSKDLVLTEGEWWCQEARTPRSEAGRGMHESRIWDRRGLHIASTWQEGLVRKVEGGKWTQQQQWFEVMQKTGRLTEAEMITMRDDMERLGLARHKL